MLMPVFQRTLDDAKCAERVYATDSELLNKPPSVSEHAPVICNPVKQALMLIKTVFQFHLHFQDAFQCDRFQGQHFWFAEHL